MVFQNVRAEQNDLEHEQLPQSGEDWVARRFRITERALSLLEERTNAQLLEHSTAISALARQFPNAQVPPVVDNGPALVAPGDPEFSEAGALPPHFAMMRELEQRLTETEAPPLLRDLPSDPAADAPDAPEPMPPSSPGTRPDNSSKARKLLHNILENTERQTDVAEAAKTIFGLPAHRAILLAAAILSLFALICAAAFLHRPHASRAVVAARPAPAILVIDATGQAVHIGNHNPAFLVPELTALAEKGDPRAQTALAIAFLRGNGVDPDPLSAGRWSQIAAGQGEARAQYILGTLYAQGIQPDPARAAHWFSAAANHGNVKAMHNLAIALLTGAGITPDSQTAVAWFTKAANKGYRDSAFDLAVLYEKGQGVMQSRNEALKWYDKAAAMGDAEATQRATQLRTETL